MVVPIFMKYDKLSLLICHCHSSQHLRVGTTVNKIIFMILRGDGEYYIVGRKYFI